MLFIGDKSATALLSFLIWSMLVFSSLCANECGNIETEYQQHNKGETATYDDGGTREGVDIILKLIPSQHVLREASQYQFRWLFFNGTIWTEINRNNTSVTIHNLTPHKFGNYRLECRIDKLVYWIDDFINSSKPVSLNPLGNSNVKPKTPPTSGVSATVLVIVTVCPVLIITVGLILINLKKRHSSAGIRPIDSSDTNSRFGTKNTTVDIYAASHYDEINDLVVDNNDEKPLTETCSTDIGSTDYYHFKEGLVYDSLPTEEKPNWKPLNGEDINPKCTKISHRQDGDRSVLCFVSGSRYASVKPKEQRRKSCPGGQGTNMESFHVWNEYATVLPRAYRKHSQAELIYIEIDHSAHIDDIVNHYDTIINMPLDPPCIYSSIDFNKKAFVAPLRRAPSSWYERKQKGL